MTGWAGVSWVMRPPTDNMESTGTMERHAELIDRLVPPVPLEGVPDDAPVMCDADNNDLRTGRGPREFKTGHCEKRATLVGISLDEPLRVRRMCARHADLLRTVE